MMDATMISGRCGQRRLPRQAVGENNGVLDVFANAVLPVSVGVRVFLLGSSRTVRG